MHRRSEKLYTVATNTFQTRKYGCVVLKRLINESHIQAQNN